MIVNNNRKIVLASGSPRRKELLAFITEEFDIKVSNTEEFFDTSVKPSEAVIKIAKEKAEAVLKLENYDNNTIVIGCDTIVCLDNTVLGKPKDELDAKNMLRLLSGKTHQVYTGVALLSNQKSELFFVKSDVSFFDLQEREIDAYIQTGEPMDKAGAYGIQGKGSLLVKEIHGDFFNIMGLPISQLNKKLQLF